VRLLQSPFALAVSQLPKLGNAKAGIARAIRYDSAAQHYELVALVSAEIAEF